MLTFVERVEGPRDAVNQVLLEHGLQPIHSLHKRQRLPVVAGELFGSPMKEPIGLNPVQLPLDVLPYDLDGKRGLTAVLRALCQESLHLEILHQMALNCLNFSLVDRDLPMNDLVEHVADLKLAAGLVPLVKLLLLCQLVLR